MNHTQAIGDVLRMLRRRFVVLGLVTTLGLLASIVFALSKHPIYESSAKILVESQRISDTLARSTVNMSAAERLQLIEQRLMTRDNLLGILDKFGLHADLPNLSTTKKIDLFRQMIRIESISVSGQGQQPEVEIFAFTITAQYGDPEKAAAIVNDLVDSAITQNLDLRVGRASDTLEYFESEAARMGEAIMALEGEIAAFKNRNEEALPDTLADRRAELARLQENDLEIDRRILELEEQSGALATVLAGGPAPTAGAGLLSPAETELRRLELDLAQKRRVLAPTHPEILRLQSQIAAVGELTEIVADADESPVASPDGLTETQRVATRRQITLLTDQAGLLRQQKQTLADRRRVLEASIRETPGVEVEINAFTRRLTEMQDQYSAITVSRAEAQTGAALEMNQQAERFNVIERALVPDDPVESDRKKVAALGSGMSVALALGLVFLIEMLNPVLRTSAQMERQLDLRPVVSIPYVSTTEERRRQWLGWAVSLILFGLALWYALSLIDRHVMPLAEIGAKISSTVGLDGLLGRTAIPPQ